ncbi:MAG: DNA cytosine methyltransferase [Rhodospirillaceae bacterium]|nr:DNA cytosine methyltransferase [Rhodospirillaceae bacterium]MDE0363777.1 DNA cytosine methyltransferase [Rhodospirillaceae bacterium]
MLLSLYAGCGAMDLGFEHAGFSIGLAYDIRPHSIRSWNRNRSDPSRGHVADLNTIRFPDIDRHYGKKFVPSGVIGGPPCQSFSRANRSPNPDDPRSKLVRRFFTLALRFHKHRGPLDFILMENVPALQKFQSGRLLDREIDRLEQNGFDVCLFFADAATHSVPQYRHRLFLLAFPNPSRTMTRWSPPDGNGQRKTVADAIRDLPSPAYFTASMDKDAIPLHENHWCMMPKSRKFSDGTLTAGDTSARSFKTLAWDKPSVTASYGHREVHVHPNGTRRLSVFEAMKLQGFPDNYFLEGTLSAQIDQVSEAVPPPLAEAVAASIRSALAISADSVSRKNYAPMPASTAGS